MLGSNNATIKAVITADDRASNVLRDFGNHTHGVASGIAKSFAAVGIAAAAVTAGVVAFGVSSVKSYQESENSLAQLNATLASTGGVAGVTAQAATELADSLQKVTKFSDEEILAAENLLLTFTKIGKDIFPEATKIVLDMSTALGQDLKSSSIQVGKALQDPILGVTALRRVGVNFNSEQQDVIKNLVETGRAAEAQRLILKELATEFGGSATAAGATFSGRLEILKNQFDEVKERIGGVLVGALTPLAEKLSTFVASEEFRVKVEKLVAWIEANMPRIIEKIEEMITKFKNWAESVDWETVINNVIAIANAFGWLIGQVSGTWENIRAIQDRFVAFFGLVVFEIQNKINGLIFVFNVLKSEVIAQWNAVLGFIGSIPGRVGALLSPIANAFLAPFQSAFHGIVALWNNTVGRISFKFPDWVPGLGGKSVAVPKFASGTSFAPGGIATVGEQGPEQVLLPRGSQVVPNNSVREGGGTTINVTVQAGAYMGSQQDARRYAQMIANALKDVAAMKGQTVTGMLG